MQYKFGQNQKRWVDPDGGHHGYPIHWIGRRSEVMAVGQPISLCGWIGENIMDDDRFTENQPDVTCKKCLKYLVKGLTRLDRNTNKQVA